MSHLITSRLLVAHNLSFDENKPFASSVSQRQQPRQVLCVRLPTVVLALIALLLLIDGEVYAGNTPIQNSKDDLELILKQEAELKAELSQRLKTANAAQNDPNSSDSEIANLRSQLSEKLDSKQILLDQLSSSNPDEPKYLYELSLTYLAKSQLTMLEPATSEEATKARLRISLSQKSQGIAIMEQIAPLDRPGFLDAHLFLAKSALKSEAKSANEKTENLRLASAHLDYALIRDPNNIEAFGLKILIAQKTEQSEEAKTYLDKLFAVDPFVYPQLCVVNDKLGVSSENMAVLLSAQQRLSAQISRMVGSSDRRTKHVTYSVDCLHRLEKLDAADKLVKMEMKEFSTDARIQKWGKRLLAIGQMLRFEAGLRRLDGKLDAKNAPELVSYLREAFHLDPNNVKALNQIVGLLRYDIPGIEKISNDIYQPDAKAPASVENLLGTIALAKADYLEAMKRFSKANAKAPNNAEYLNNLACVYLTRPDPDPREALKLADRAIGGVESGEVKSRHLTNFYDTKGRALLALGRIAEEAGDQKLANRRYSAAVANLLRALIDVDIDKPEDTPLERGIQLKRGLAISQAVVGCYEASGQPRQAKVWKDRVKQLQTIENENQAELVK